MSTTPQTSMTCALVGADTLLIECGEILLGKGHQIDVIAAGSRRVAAWARTKGIDVVDATTPASQWHGALAQHSFEWLLAITHLAILPDHVLALATRGAVNFHDGPLPEYAGLNTPAWALLRGEREYGISWHMITSGVDEGDILKQRRFEIAEAETSLSLNTRNFEAAIETFEELVDELASGTYSRTPQDREAVRRTFTRDDRPEAMAVLDWRRPAADLERTIRALDFGRYPNPLGCAKLFSAAGALIVSAATVIDANEAANDSLEPGTVASADHDRLVVSCGRGQLAITALATLTGEPCSPDRAAAEFGLGPGSRLPVLDDVARASWSALGRKLAKAERYHLPELLALRPIEVPWGATPAAGHQPRFETVVIDVPADIAGDDGLVVGSFGVLLARLSGKDHFHVALSAADWLADFRAVAPLTATAVPFAVTVMPTVSIGRSTSEIADALTAARTRAPYAVELIARTPDLAAVPELAAGRSLPVAVRIDADDGSSSPSGVDVTGERARGVAVELLRVDGRWRIDFDAALITSNDAKLLATGLESVIRELVADPGMPVAEVDLLGSELRRRVLEDWNATAMDVPAGACTHHLFEQQVDRTPDVTAVIFEDQAISYRALDERANQLAFLLIELGIGPDRLVGVHVNRGIDLLVSVLAVQKAGGAYVPLDPVYPTERLEHMIRDSRCQVILTDAAARGTLPVTDDPSIAVVRVDADRHRYEGRPAVRPRVIVQPHDLAYCIYTSGSTGLPKGVLVEHDNVINFFAGMDDVVPHELPATWFAVTSLSFDISVLELLYTLTRGFSVVVYLDRDRSADDPAPNPAMSTTSPIDGHVAAPMEFSLFYFSGDEADGQGADKYRLLLEGAKWADRHGFCAVWTPERHFHAFGGLYPQPAVTSAAVAAITTNIGIRAGSVVMPLHHPIRVAEAWSIVDNISNGRVAISFASGWQPNDFVLMPQNYSNAKQAMFDGIDMVKRLWRGERIAFDGATGSPVEVTTLPRPVQPELPVWITTAGNPDTYIQAGRIGANLLTHLLGQSVDQLAPKIELYRKARADAGFDPDSGIVSLMLHTFVGDNEDAVREVVRKPLKQYLGTSFSLLKEYAWAFPAFQRPAAADDGGGLADEDFKHLSAADLDAVLEFAFLRYYETSGLFGTAERCRGMVHRLRAIGVNEIACLIDFGVNTETVLASLPHLDELRRPSDHGTSTTGIAAADAPPAGVAADSDHAAATAPPSPNVQTVAAQLGRHRVTHLQCTPSMARMLSMQEDSQAALAGVEHLFIGGEAFPVALAKDLKAMSGSRRITNMYGPTETTIWSTTWLLDGELDEIPIGAPIANTQVYILDKHRQPLPPGVAGELWIGGRGVVRGYHDRSELTAERFVPDPFRGDGQRMYATGDLARWREQEDGSAIVEFLGRADHQVKIRGYRIELGEIEAQLGTYPGVVECVVAVREDTPGDQQLVAYVSAGGDAIIDPTTLKARLRQHLPEVMVPAHIAVLAELPHTPNGKIDRNRLPSLAEVLGSRGRDAEPVAAANELERQVLIVWEETLGATGVSVDDNFFDIGGHSLLVVRMHRRLKDEFGSPIPLTDLYRYPTVRGFAAALASDAGAAVVQGGLDRAARRRERMRRQ